MKAKNESPHKYLNCCHLFLYHIFFILSSDDEYLDTLQILAIMNSAIINTEVQYLFDKTWLCHFCLCQIAELNHMESLFLVLFFLLFKIPIFCSTVVVAV